MKLILNSDVQSLGRKGDVVDVAKGYARNYLQKKREQKNTHDHASL